MTNVEVFEPPMCCSTGVCVPNIDPALVRFAADLHWLASEGVHVKRYNLGQRPQAFAASQVVKTTLEAVGNQCLPLILADGKIAIKGAYPMGIAKLAERVAMAPWTATTPVGPGALRGLAGRSRGQLSGKGALQ